MAHVLLENNDEQVRFFGALTFIVKLNTDAYVGLALKITM